MSTIAVDNARPSLGGTSTALIDGLPKAWASFIPGTPALSETNNVGSLTDNGAGDFEVNYTNSMGSATYAYANATGETSATTAPICALATSNTSNARTSAMQPIAMYTIAGTLTDFDSACVYAFGDLA